MSFLNNLGFIGGGNMSTALVRGILKNGTIPASNIWVSGPHLENLNHWKELGVNVTTKNGEVFYNCNVIFLGVKPAMLTDAVNDCLDTIPNRKTVLSKSVIYISMLAGITIDTLRKTLKVLSPAMFVVRIMPNTPVMFGSGACLYTPDHIIGQEMMDVVLNILNSCGMCEKIPEQLMDSLGSLVGCGPAFMYIAIEALADGAVKQGVPRKLAERFAAQVLIGSGQMVLQSGKHPGLLKDEVCSPGGSTICGVAEIERGKLRGTLINAVEASVLKTKEFNELLSKTTLPQ